MRQCLLSTVVQACANVVTVGGFLAVTGRLSVYVFGTGVLAAHAATCMYVLWQKRKAFSCSTHDASVVSDSLGLDERARIHDIAVE
jgi:hypothetical protein